MSEIIAELLANPGFRSLVEGIAIKIVADIFHRQKTDPTFLANSDQAFSALSTAQSDEEKQNALLAIQRLMAS